MNELISYFSYQFVWRAFFGGLLIAMNCGLIGPFLVLQRLSLLSDGYGHIALAGVAVGLLLGTNPIITVFAVVVGASVLIQWALRHNILSDAVISLLISFGVATSIVLISLANGFNTNLYSYLIGSLYTLTLIDLVYIVIACAATLVYLKIFYPTLLLLTFNEQLAELTNRRRYRLAKNLFLTLTAINVVITIRAVGILLVSSMTVIPALISIRNTLSMRATLICSTVIAMLALIFGILVALLLDIPPSGTIVLCLLLIFIAMHIGKKKNRRFSLKS